MAGRTHFHGRRRVRLSRAGSTLGVSLVVFLAAAPLMAQQAGKASEAAGEKDDCDLFVNVFVHNTDCPSKDPAESAPGRRDSGSGQNNTVAGSGASGGNAAAAPQPASSPDRSVSQESQEPAEKTAQSLEGFAMALAGIVKRHAIGDFAAWRREDFYDAASQSVIIPEAFKKNDTTARRKIRCIEDLAVAIQTAHGSGLRFEIDFEIYAGDTLVSQRDVAGSACKPTSIDDLAACRADFVRSALKELGLGESDATYLRVVAKGYEPRYCARGGNCAGSDKRADRRIELRIRSSGSQ